MKLKTLKDIKCIVGDRLGNEECKGFDCKANRGCRYMGVSFEELRQEAINWIKDIRIKAKKDKYDSENYTHRARMDAQQWAYGQVSWIMTFFDLTEHDLK